jgi:surface antigen
MIMKLRYIPIVIAVLAAPAFAMNMSVFKDAPVTRLSAEELKTFSSTIQKTLETGADGVTVEWKAPKTPFTSKITPVSTVTEGKRKCRDATIESEAKDRFQRGTYSFCKADTGPWQLRSPSSKTAKK